MSTALKERAIGLGPCDLLSLPEVAKVLRIREKDARKFCQARGLVRYFAGRARVVAGDLARAGSVSEAVDEARTEIWTEGRVKL
jgi:hypothetical protein